jgi:PPE-repeat protein
VDFGAQPPEITSARMYSGPGVGSMLSAAVAWDALAAELQSTAASYGAVISELISGSWMGASSASMAAAAAPYVTWMSTTAAQAKEAATQARAAASAYETAFAATVPPPMIAANRSQLASLVATNIFGQNTGAIAATEALYGQMWAQDAAAMYGYAGSSATATRVTPFREPPQTTNEGAQAGQAAAAARAAATAAGTHAQAAQSPEQFGLIPQTLQGLASAGSQPSTEMGNLLTNSTGSSSVASTYEDLFSLANSVNKFRSNADVTMSIPNMAMSEFLKSFDRAAATVDIPKSSLGAGLAAVRPEVSGRLAGAVSAGVGEASAVGALSVPPNWAGATPAIRLAATVLPSTSLAAAPVAELPSSLLSQAALGSLTGGALAGSAPRVVSGTGVRGRATPGKKSAAPVKLDRVIAQLQQQPDVVQHWQVDQAGLDELLAKLSTKPGIHAVHLSAGNGNDSAAPKTQFE